MEPAAPGRGLQVVRGLLRLLQLLQRRLYLLRVLRLLRLLTVRGRRQFFSSGGEMRDSFRAEPVTPHFSRMRA